MKSLFLYLLLVGLPALAVLGVLQMGQGLTGQISAEGNPLGPAEILAMPHVARLLAQVAVVLLLSRLVGRSFRRIHQPQVMGEMVAGILLGPSLLGWLFPQVLNALFPASSLGFLNALSQLGVVLYMFLVGLHLDPRTLRRHRHAAFVISHASIICPFLLGALLALYLYPRLSDGNATFTQFALFVGTAMSITAFPVLARIVADGNLLHTKVGMVAIACAAVDDVTAWCILAGVVLFVRAGAVPAVIWTMVIGSAVYAVAMLLGVRRALARLGAKFEDRGTITHEMLAVIILLMFASGWITESLGIHALFGAFLMGVIMPKQPQFVAALSDKLEPITVVLFLPLFFAFTGLRTSMGLLSEPASWFYCGLIILVAIAGKFGGSILSTRLSGMSWRESSAIGTLMNTRGLMELVVLNIGLDVGAISHRVFTMMVFMALVTTFMAAPLLDWIYPIEARSKTVVLPAAAEVI